VTDPLHQFQIQVLAPLFKIGDIQFNFTNSAVFMLAIVAIICALLYAAFSRAELVPSRLQAAGEVWYEFVQDMVRQVMGRTG
jgi:F-type H+-transporting ATPase subunit a